MSGEIITVVGTPSVLESNGAAIASGAVAIASMLSYDISANSNFPDAEFALIGSFATAPVEGSLISLYARPLTIDGTNSTQVPEATRPTVFIGNFIVDNVTGSQSMTLWGGFAQDVPRKADYYLHNNGTGQMLSAGWTLKVTPRTRKAAP